MSLVQYLEPWMVVTILIILAMPYGLLNGKMLAGMPYTKWEIRVAVVCLLLILLLTIDISIQSRK